METAPEQSSEAGHVLPMKHRVNGILMELGRMSYESLMLVHLQAQQRAERAIADVAVTARYLDQRFPMGPAEAGGD